MRRWAADVLSLTRLVLLIPWMWCTLSGSVWTLPAMAVIAATDLFDGPLARWLSTSGPRGMLLDAGCDTAIAVVALTTLGASDGRYWGLAGLAATAVLAWGLRCLSAGRLAHTRLGRYNGAFCYLALLVGSLRPWLERFRLRPPAALESALLALVAAWLMLSAVENATATFATLRRPE